MKLCSKKKGFTLVELMVVQTMMVVVAGVLFVLYGQSAFIFKRGSAKITMHQTARQALVRTIPLIASANSRPEDPPQIDSRTVLPDGTPGPGHNLQAVIEPAPPADPDNPPPRPGPDSDDNTQIILRSTDHYAAEILRKAPLEAAFNPRDAFRWQTGPNRGTPYPITSGIYRLFYNRDMTKTANAEDAPGGRIGTLNLDGNTPDDPSDDIVLSRGLYNVQFIHELRNTVDVVVIVKAHLPRAGGRMASQLAPGASQAEIDQVVRTTRVFLPIETNSPGGA
jgi:type II secretory pathway pseudopilin PulG